MYAPSVAERLNRLSNLLNFLEVTEPFFIFLTISKFLEQSIHFHILECFINVLINSCNSTLEGRHMV